MKKDRILLVDDDESTCIVLKKGLEKVGLKVDTFYDPIDALSHFKAGKYDLLLLDIKLPEMSGFDLYRRMKEIDSNVEVCFLTGFDVYQKEFHLVFPSLSPKCCVKKPISIVTLAGTLEAILKCV